MVKKNKILNVEEGTCKNGMGISKNKICQDRLEFVVYMKIHNFYNICVYPHARAHSTYIGICVLAYTFTCILCTYTHKCPSLSAKRVEK